MARRWDTIQMDTPINKDKALGCGTNGHIGQ